MSAMEELQLRICKTPCSDEDALNTIGHLESVLAFRNFEIQRLKKQNECQIKLLEQYMENEMTIKVNFEVTDLFSGEANYSWVKRSSIEFKEQPTSLQIVRALKKFAGLQNIKCKKDDFGDQIALYPVGMCVVAFANMEY